MANKVSRIHVLIVLVRIYIYPKQELQLSTQSVSCSHKYTQMDFPSLIFSSAQINAFSLVIYPSMLRCKLPIQFGNIQLLNHLPEHKECGVHFTLPSTLPPIQNECEFKEQNSIIGGSDDHFYMSAFQSPDID